MGRAGPALAHRGVAARPGQLSAPRWGLGEAALGYLGSLIGAQLLLAVAVAAKGSPDVDLALITASLFGSYAGFVGVALYAARRKGSGSLARDFGLTARPVDLPLGIAAGLFSTFVLVPAASYPVERLFPEIDLSEAARELTDAVSGRGMVVFAVLVAVCTPIVEELFFRGLLQRSLMARLPPAAAIAISALLFGLAHLQAPQLPALVAFGVLLGILAHRTGRLGPGIVAHSAFNLATVVVLVVERS